MDALIKAEWKCEWCGATGNLTYDHIVAVVNGGKNHGGNLSILCFDCNQRKGALIGDEVESIRRRIQEEKNE